uniref:Uncharacterized protein n=1 Tax=Oryza nivara TaxID=4536 RepID=A0A0E0I2N6_ORYNI
MMGHHEGFVAMFFLSVHGRKLSDQCDAAVRIVNTNGTSMMDELRKTLAWRCDAVVGSINTSKMSDAKAHSPVNPAE